jgi:CubicO group peptidase (beta-lactamase class C family)
VRRSFVGTLLALGVLMGAGIGGALVPLPSQPADVPWPTVAWPERPLDAVVDRRVLETGITLAFEAIGRSGLPDTRALLVVHRGAIVTERYASGFGAESRFQSYSVAKSITHALVGILVRQGKLDVHAPADVAAWHREGDPRGAITLEQLIRMTSGLDGADDDDRPLRSFPIEMTYGAGARDVAAFAEALPLVHPPGTHWAYSTASTTIVAHLIGRAVGGGRDGMLTFMHDELFAPLGMHSVVPEFDSAGTFEGGMFVHATARDYARFGLLYLRDGVWDGKRILPDGWVDFARTAAPASNNGVYGAGFWVNGKPADAPMQFRILAGGPDSTFGASGVFGQLIVIVPTRDLLVVRLGLVDAITYPVIKESLALVVAAFPDEPTAGGSGLSLR